MEIEDVSGGPTSMTEIEWNTAISNAISGWSYAQKIFIDPSVNQHSEGTTGVYFRTLSQLTKAVYLSEIKRRLSIAIKLNTAVLNSISQAGANAIDIPAACTDATGIAASSGISLPIQRTICNEITDARNDSDSWIKRNGLNSKNEYAIRVEQYSLEILKIIFNNKLNNKNGVNIFHTTRSTNLVTDQDDGYIIGLAYDFTNASNNECGFLLMSEDSEVACGNEKLSAHEIGHHLFLPHPPDTAEKQDYKAHDQDINSCLMSYNYHTKMELCGFCQLRVRGWDKRKINTKSHINHKK